MFGEQWGCAGKATHKGSLKVSLGLWQGQRPLNIGGASFKKSIPPIHPFPVSAIYSTEDVPNCSAGNAIFSYLFWWWSVRTILPTVWQIQLLHRNSSTRTVCCLRMTCYFRIWTKTRASYTHRGWTPFYFMYDPKCSTTFSWCMINVSVAFVWCTINAPVAFAWYTNHFVHKVEFSYIWWNGVHPLWYWIHGPEEQELEIGSGRRIYLNRRDKYLRLDHTQNVSWSAWAYLERHKSYQDHHHRKCIVIGWVVISFRSWMSISRTYLNRLLRRKYIVN